MLYYVIVKLMVLQMLRCIIMNFKRLHILRAECLFEILGHDLLLRSLLLRICSMPYDMGDVIEKKYFLQILQYIQSEDNTQEGQH